jgi:hypothetical protein
MRYGLFSVLLLVCTVNFPCFGQVDRADLEGTVTDSSGGGISGAKITITANATGIEDERTTIQYGYYRFPSIALGLYSVVVNHDGFKVKKSRTSTYVWETPARKSTTYRPMDATGQR